MVENNKDRIAVKKELNERKAELTTKKAELEKPAGNNTSAKVKEFYDEQERIEDDIREAEVAAKKDGWRVREFGGPTMPFRGRCRSVPATPH